MATLADLRGNWGAILFALIAVYCAVIFLMNRYRPHGNKVKVLHKPDNLPDKLDATLTLTSWNIGYGGLGKESDFVTDGGKSWFPPSLNAVKKNIGGILSQLEKFRDRSAPHLMLLQEVSNRSPLSYWQPLRQSILDRFTRHFALFRPDISSWGLPWPIKINHGTMTLCPASPKSAKVIALPAEPTFLGGFIKRNYGLLVTKFQIKNSPQQWIIINLHLAAFDPEGATRFEQLQKVLSYAEEEFSKGNFVVLGGDWNMALTPSNFPHTTDIKKLFWLVSMPTQQLPTGWQIICDPQTPTVRTNYQPYVRGENYTAIIDGFVISPNIQVKNVCTTDTRFLHTDHMPVTATFSTKPSKKG